MSTSIIVLLVIAFLAAPVCLLAGVGAGACLVWRVMKGQPPLPTFFSRNKTSKVVSAKPPENDKPKPPRVAA